MEIQAEQIEALKLLFPGRVGLLEEGKVSYILVRGVIPPGQKEAVDLLLCPTARDNYPSRLFLSRQISTPTPRNWNASVRIGDRAWFAISWRVPTNLTLVEMITTHLRAFK